MNASQEELQGARRTVAARLSGWFAGPPERTILLGTILLLSALSAVIRYGLIQYAQMSALSDLVFEPDDCYPGLDARPLLGHLHCFSDYGWAAYYGMQSDPWGAHPPLFGGDMNDYTAGALLPAMVFAVITAWFHIPTVGLVTYLLVMTLAVLYPAVWAARGARGLERIVVFVAIGAAAIPAWAAIDRGNAIALLAPIGLIFLVALSRHRWGVVAIAVVLAALIKPQFVVLVLVLFAARKWRLGGVTVTAAAISNLAAYLLWPARFPGTIVRSIRNAFIHGSAAIGTDRESGNVSFQKGLLALPDHLAHGGLPGVARLMIGLVLLVVFSICILALGRRIPPFMSGIVLLATASLCPVLTYSYYLIFALPVAALVARDPDGSSGSGIFGRLAGWGANRRVVFVCVTAAAAVSIAQVPIPIPRDADGSVPTTAILASLLWLVACAAIIVSYARRPAARLWNEPAQPRQEYPRTPPRELIRR